MEAVRCANVSNDPESSGWNYPSRADRIDQHLRYSRTRRESSVSSVSPPSSNCADADDQVSLKLRDIADTQTLSHRRIRTDDEFCGHGFLEDDLQHAVLKLDLEAFRVGEWQQRPLRAFERMIGLQTEVLLGQRLVHALH